MKKTILLLLGFSLLLLPVGTVSAESPLTDFQHTKPGFWSKPIPLPVMPDEPFYAPTTEPEPVDAPAATVVPAAVTDPNGVPTLEGFATQVRDLGYLGLWSEGLFAFRVYGLGWGQVPNELNTASYATYDTYGAYFIHDYLGGSKLYSAKAGTRVAVIRPNRIDWFIINNGAAFRGTSNGQVCGYQEPYVPWGQDLATGTQFTTIDIIQAYFSMPFAIQTCYCRGDMAGVFILTGVWDTP